MSKVDNLNGSASRVPKDGLLPGPSEAAPRPTLNTSPETTGPKPATERPETHTEPLAGKGQSEHLTGVQDHADTGPGVQDSAPASKAPAGEPAGWSVPVFRRVVQVRASELKPGDEVLCDGFWRTAGTVRSAPEGVVDVYWLDRVEPDRFAPDALVEVGQRDEAEPAATPPSAPLAFGSKPARELDEGDVVRLPTVDGGARVLRAQMVSPPLVCVRWGGGESPSYFSPDEALQVAGAEPAATPPSAPERASVGSWGEPDPERVRQLAAERVRELAAGAGTPPSAPEPFEVPAWRLWVGDVVQWDADWERRVASVGLVDAGGKVVIGFEDSVPTGPIDANEPVRVLSRLLDVRADELRAGDVLDDGREVVAVCPCDGAPRRCRRVRFDGGAVLHWERDRRVNVRSRLVSVSELRPGDIFEAPDGTGRLCCVEKVEHGGMVVWARLDGSHGGTFAGHPGRRLRVLHRPKGGDAGPAGSRPLGPQPGDGDSADAHRAREINARASRPEPSASRAMPPSCDRTAALVDALGDLLLVRDQLANIPLGSDTTAAHWMTYAHRGLTEAASWLEAAIALAHGPTEAEVHDDTRVEVGVSALGYWSAFASGRLLRRAGPLWQIEIDRVGVADTPSLRPVVLWVRQNSDKPAELVDEQSREWWTRRGLAGARVRIQGEGV